MEHEGEKRPAEESGSSKRMKVDELLNQLSLNTEYQEDNFLKLLSEAFSQKKSHTFEHGARILGKPFTCCELPNFIKPEEFVTQFKTEVDELEVEVKLNDLYQFKQSKDLGSSVVPEISAFKKFLYGKCLKWMKKVTGIELTDKVDLSCSCYTYTDHLLCHDDELEGRRIAYIYYIVPEWEEEWGGTLDLFNTVDNEPTEICTSLIPAWNKLIFFEVSQNSYHQVAEILDFKMRTSISGWFYGPPLKPAIRPSEIISFAPPSKGGLPINLKEWINPTYLQVETQQDIRESFEESSEMELMDFLEASKFEEVCNALKDDSIPWKLKGPASKRRYEELGPSAELPPILQECRALFSCEPFLEVLLNLTGLRLHPNGEEDTAMGEVNCCMRRWKQGCYTLLHDQAFLGFATLNAGLCFNWPDWDVEFGGYTSYVAKDEKDELLRVDPKPNSLALVYITEGTSSFVKYFNSRVSDSFYNDIFAMYKEPE